MSDDMTVAFDEQLQDDLADKAAAQTKFVWDEGYYLAQYSKHTLFASDKETFERKDGSGSFANPLFNVPVGAFVFNLLGVGKRKSDPITEFEAPKGFSFRATFKEVANDRKKLVQESVNGGMLQSGANNGSGKMATVTQLLDWYANNMVVIHIGRNKEWTGDDGREHPASNVIRAIRPYKV